MGTQRQHAACSAVFGAWHFILRGVLWLATHQDAAATSEGGIPAAALASDGKYPLASATIAGNELARHATGVSSAWLSRPDARHLAASSGPGRTGLAGNGARLNLSVF